MQHCVNHCHFFDARRQIPRPLARQALNADQRLCGITKPSQYTTNSDSPKASLEPCCLPYCSLSALVKRLNCLGKSIRMTSTCEAPLKPDLCRFPHDPPHRSAGITESFPVLSQIPKRLRRFPERPPCGSREGSDPHSGQFSMPCAG